MLTLELSSPTNGATTSHAPHSLTQPSFEGHKSARYEMLDLWRGVACLLVVLYHSTLIFRESAELNGSLSATWGEQILKWLHHGSVGVPMFFVISGYCIAATACSAQRRKTPLSTYFWRRFKRIYPPYWAALALLVAAFVVFDVLLQPGVLSSQPWMQSRPWWFSPSQWLGNVTLTETWRHHVGGSSRGHILGQSWTLCYEEQFYLVMGLLLLFPRRAFFPLCGAITVGCVLLQQSTHWLAIDVSGFFFDGHWLSFAFGIAVYYLVNQLGTKGQWVGFVALLATGAAFVAVPGLEGKWVPFAAWFAALLVVLRRWDGTAKGNWLLAPFFVCGTMCYSLYLVHQLIVAGISRAMYHSGVDSAWGTLLITVPVCTACSLAAGWLFYLTVERRFLNAQSEVAAS